MSDDFSREPPEISPDFAPLLAQRRGASVPGAGELPTTDFVGSLNGLGGSITLQQGTVPAGITVAFTQGAHTISFNMSGFGVLATAKCNVDTVPPTVNDDDTQGYSPFSEWIDSSIAPGELYVCMDATTGAAVWLQLRHL